MEAKKLRNFKIFAQRRMQVTTWVQQYLDFVFENSQLKIWSKMVGEYRHETEAQKKKLENGSRIWGSAILKEVFSGYEGLSSREVIFIHKYSCVFFFRRLSLISLEFFHLICLNHKTPVNLPKNRKSAENRTNLMPVNIDPE